ncbi:GTPase-activating protein [Apophysomyces sp. BC1034]|nr:GTPase-activating protein [Apophysomyces sp. BC1015]KAG0167890.1 GTPase-activating protein [Apophysomyces sp. BC1021]KAG0183976.1 GTPase-activating protein [Apophysomyces sp. BC1034]
MAIHPSANPTLLAEKVGETLYESPPHSPLDSSDAYYESLESLDRIDLNTIKSQEDRVTRVGKDDEHENVDQHWPLATTIQATKSKHRSYYDSDNDFSSTDSEVEHFDPEGEDEEKVDHSSVETPAMSQGSSTTEDSYFDVPSIDGAKSADTATASPGTPPKDYPETPDASRRSLRLSKVSASDLNEISLDDMNMSTPTTAASCAVQESDNVAVPIKRQKPPQPSPIDTQSYRRGSADTATTPKSIFSLWSPFKGTPSRRTSQSSVVSTPLQRPSLQYTARQQKRLSRPQSIVQLPAYQEALLAQMEQLNTANTTDPKAQRLLNLKRQSLRKSLLAIQNKNDDYDWGILHIQFGIPPSIRGMVWQLLAKSKDTALEAKYAELLKSTSPYEKMIQRDLARTFPGHKFFKDRDGVGQEGLYNVVRAYSIYDQEVGYCQGLAFIVGPLLLNMPDEEAFCVLVQLMNKHGLRGHFTPDMEGLHQRLYQFESLVEEHLPHVFRHLDRQGVTSTMYASQWFMTLFAYKFPLNLVYRIYDVLLTEGIGSVFKFAIALLKRNQTAILGLDFEHLLDFLKNGLFEDYKDDDRRLVADACVLEIPPRRLIQLEKEHKAHMEKEAADARLLDELQRTHVTLRKRATELDNSAQALKTEQADVQGQLRASQHDLSHVHDENSSLQMLVDSLRDEVQALPSKIEAGSRSQFDSLCNENASLVEKNSVLEDRLAHVEALLIDMKLRYAQSENDREELSKRLGGMKKLLGA